MLAPEVDHLLNWRKQGFPCWHGLFFFFLSNFKSFLLSAFVPLCKIRCMFFFTVKTYLCALPERIIHFSLFASHFLWTSLIRWMPSSCLSDYLWFPFSPTQHTLLFISNVMGYFLAGNDKDWSRDAHWALFTNNLGKFLWAPDHGVMTALQTTKVFHSENADDIALTARTAHHLQLQLDRLHTFTKVWVLLLWNG